MKVKRMIAALVLTGASLFAGGFTLQSSAISGQLTLDQEFDGFGCTGKNISPDLSWKDAPKGTRSFGITVYDPDAPTGSGWWHWVVFDIPKSATGINAGASASGKLPKGAVESMTDYGQSGFGGACPPRGDKPHRYIVTVYALDTVKLGPDARANPALIGYMLNAHALAKCSVMGYYGR